MPVVIVGDGAVGKGLAVALTLSGESVFLAGPDGTRHRSVTLGADGFLQGLVTVETGVVTEARPGSVMICALKAYSIAGALAGMRAASPRCIISVSNGLDLWGAGGEPQPEPAVLTAGFLLSGSVVHTSPGAIYVGNDSEARRLFQKSAIPVVPVCDMKAVVNAKWLVNSIINPLGALTGLPNDRLLSAGLKPLLDTLFDELSRVVPEDSHDQAREMLAGLLQNSGNFCSMLQDLRAGNPTELQWLTGIAEKRLPGGCPTARVLCALVRAKAEASLRSSTLLR
ncbi:MAG: ketopantoate reductase C-terminal domain-containing protein [Candidatus Fermentibacteraceae bacterium]